MHTDFAALAPAGWRHWPLTVPMGRLEASGEQAVPGVDVVGC